MAESDYEDDYEYYDEDEVFYIEDAPLHEVVCYAHSKLSTSCRISLSLVPRNT